VVGGIMVVAILGFVAILNAYEIPERRLQRMFEARGEVMPEGFTAGYGVPYLGAAADRRRHGDDGHRARPGSGATSSPPAATRMRRNCRASTRGC
jgi:hypothetical protein